MNRISLPAPWKKAVKTGLLTFLGIRLWSSATLLLLNVFPADVTPTDEPARGMLALLEHGSVLNHLFLAPWYRWDTVHYLDIAQNGYSRAFLTVWPPMYSALIHLLSLTGVAPIAAAVLVSNLCAVGALVLFYRMAGDLSDETANRALFFFAVFPTAFFLVAAYSESLFILLAAGCLLAGRQRSLWLAGFLASLAVLTRLQGIILSLPLLYEGITIYCQFRRGKQWHVRLMDLLKLASPAALPVLTAVSFVVYVRFCLRYPWPWETLSIEWGQHAGWPWEGIIGNFTSLAGIRLLETPINPLAQATDLAAIVFLLIMVGLMIKDWREFPVPYILYTAAGLILILTKIDNQGLLVSASRYSLSLFPVFIYAAVKRHKQLSPWANLLVIALGLTLQAVLMVSFARWIWIA